MAPMSELVVDPSNAAQAQAWDGDEGAYWAAHADLFEASLRDYHAAFAAAAAVQPADRVLDVGCGNGQTTRDAARAAARGAVLGVDLSAAMLDVARARAMAEGLTNVEFAQADAQVHPFEPSSYDVVISRTALMFFGQPTAGLGNLARAAKPGGRLVALVWQPLAANEWIAEIAGSLSGGRPMQPPPPDAPSPFALSDPDRTRHLLTEAGWSDVECTALERRMYFGATVDEAHAFVAGLMGWMLRDRDDAARAAALDALRASMTAHLTDEGVSYASGAWLVTARR